MNNWGGRNEEMFVLLYMLDYAESKIIYKKKLFAKGRIYLCY